MGLLSVYLICNIYSYSSLAFKSGFLKDRPRDSNTMLSSVFDSGVGTSGILADTCACLPCKLPAKTTPGGGLKMGLLRTVDSLCRDFEGGTSSNPAGLCCGNLLDTGGSLTGTRTCHCNSRDRCGTVHCT